MRRSKAPLAFMEQIVMVLVFAMAAALCVQVFVKCAMGSREIEAGSLALSAAQTVGDAVRTGDAATLSRYGIAFVPGEDVGRTPLRDGRDFESAGLSVSVEYGDPDGCLWTAVVSVSGPEGREIVSITVSGQIGGRHGEA